MAKDKRLDKPITTENITTTMYIIGITFIIAGTMNLTAQIITGSILIIIAMIITYLNKELEEDAKWIKKHKKK